MLLRHIVSLPAILVALLSTSLASGQLARFTDVAGSKGLGTIDAVPGDGHAPAGIFNDLNNDGWADIYVMGPRNWGGGFMLPNQLYLNVPDGSGGRTFQQVANAAGAGGGTGEHNGAISADYDNDGDQDIYVLNWVSSDDITSGTGAFDPRERNTLYRNNLIETGSLGFTDVTASTDPTPGNPNDDQRGVGYASKNGVALNNSLTAAWADVDRDGLLDLYVGTHHGWSNWEPGHTPGQRDTFYYNNGDGTFADLTEVLGLEGFETATGQHSTGTQDYSSSNAVQFADFNNDGWQDLLVTNKVGGPPDRNMLYMNQGDDGAGNWLGFENVSYDLPTANFGALSGAAMGVDVGDIDNDGDLDFYITDWSDPANQYAANGNNDLWINQLSETGTLNFIHSSQLSAKFSWGTKMDDFDNNGYLDIYVGTDPDNPDYLYMNSEGGFGGSTGVTAGLFDTKGVRGAMSADYDHDGLMDLLVIKPWNFGGSKLYENISDVIGTWSDPNYLVLKLIGDPTLPGQYKSSRDAIGARVYLSTDLDGDGTIEPNETMMREVHSGSSNAASTSSLELEFGLGQGDEAMITVIWPSGRVTVIGGVGVNQYMTIVETAPLPGDADGDGDVDLDDFQVLTAGMYTVHDAGPTGGDFNNDGETNFDDYVILSLNFGVGGPDESLGNVPEPGVGAVVMVVLGAVAGRGRPGRSYLK